MKIFFASLTTGGDWCIYAVTMRKKRRRHTDEERPKSRKRQRHAAPRKQLRSAVSRKRRSSPARKSRSKLKPISAGNRVRVVRDSTAPERAVSARDRSLHALNDMRHGASITQAGRDNGVTTRTIKKYVASALVQDRPGGRIRPTKSDRFVRYLQIPGPHGSVEIRARGSKEAADVARYKAAVNRWLGGDLKALAPWRGKKIAGVELITDPRVLKSLAQQELLPYSLYRSLAGGAT
jgi:hypothetical protein